VGDAAITARVKAALLAEKNVKSSAIDVDAFQGKVILRGTVPDREQAALAAKVAAAVEGVKTVDNRLGVH
jgi:hyperosmotically inducible protein